MKKHQNARPVNLNLFTIRFPLPAIVSILHRVSGVVLFLLIPAFLWFLHCSLLSGASFDRLAAFVSQLWVKCILFVSFCALIYHVFAGLRHLCLDMGLGGGSLQVSRLTAMLVFVLTAVCAALLGVRLLW